MPWRAVITSSRLEFEDCVRVLNYLVGRDLVSFDRPRALSDEERRVSLTFAGVEALILDRRARLPLKATPRLRPNTTFSDG